MNLCSKIKRSLNELKFKGEQLILEYLSEEDKSDLEECGYFIKKINQSGKLVYLISEN